MADSKISDLTTGTTPQDADEFVVARAGVTRKLDWASLKTAAGISVADAGGLLTATNVEAALAEIINRFSAGAKVSKSGAQSINNNTETALTWDQEEWDTDTFHDTGSNTDRLTIPATGRYAVSAGVGFTANATGVRRVTVRLTNTSGTLLHRVEHTSVSAASNTYVQLYMEDDFATSDIVIIGALQTSGGPLDILAANTVATIRRIA